jgi:hypothetical protein
MGQYQQWLFAQEIDRRLRGEIESLETELLYLRDRIAILEQSVPETENVILQALQAHFHNETEAGAAKEEQGLAQATEAPPLNWKNLPRQETPQAQTPYFASSYTSPGGAEDVLAFFDRQGQTDTPFFSWRARDSQQAANEAEEEHPQDEETRRLNERISRWFMRWHRQIVDAEQQREAQNES